MTRRSTRLLVMGSALLAGLVGCGGGGDEAQTRATHASMPSQSVAATAVDPKRPQGGPGSVAALLARIDGDRDYWSAEDVALNGLYIDRSGTVVVATERPDAAAIALRQHYADDRIRTVFGLPLVVG
jgi:hypothetical protein